MCAGYRGTRSIVEILLCWKLNRNWRSCPVACFADAVSGDFLGWGRPLLGLSDVRSSDLDGWLCAWDLSRWLCLCLRQHLSGRHQHLFEHPFSAEFAGLRIIRLWKIFFEWILKPFCTACAISGKQLVLRFLSLNVFWPKLFGFLRGGCIDVGVHNSDPKVGRLVLEMVEIRQKLCATTIALDWRRCLLYSIFCTHFSVDFVSRTFCETFLLPNFFYDLKFWIVH